MARFITDYIMPIEAIHVSWYPEEGCYYAAHWDLLNQYIKGSDLELLMAQARVQWPYMHIILHMGHAFYF